jgi:hypothetical protein
MGVNDAACVYLSDEAEDIVVRGAVWLKRSVNLMHM